MEKKLVLDIYRDEPLIWTKFLKKELLADKLSLSISPPTTAFGGSRRGTLSKFKIDIATLLLSNIRSFN